MKEETKSSHAHPVIEALLDTGKVFPARYLTFFSDIAEQDLTALRSAWPQVSVQRKISLLTDLEAIMEADSLIACDALAMFALGDEDPHVRSHAISLLWECENLQLVGIFGEMLEKDPSDLVQVSAATGLGRFVLMSELDEVPDSAGRQAVMLLKKRQAQNPRKELQQEILMALAYTGGAEISSQIEKAYNDDDRSWRLAAVIAMGRTADDRWEDHVLESIDSGSLPIQSEAVKAAGEIELDSARVPLLEMLEYGISDLEVRLHVIWALARIGGEDVRSAIQGLLDDAENDEEIEVIELALEHLDFLEELPDLDF